jgi:beta-glucosidase
MSIALLKKTWMHAAVLPAFLSVAHMAFAGEETALFRDARLPVERRVDDVMRRLSTEQKTALCYGVSEFDYGEIKELGVAAIGMTDGPQGVRMVPATKFPCGLAMAATWNPGLIEEVGTALGRETLGAGRRVLLGPGVNIMRTPLGGRTFEYMGEDPLLAGKMAAAYIRGVQGTGVAACVKHFACNNQERWRRSIDVRVGERALREVYLPAFKAAIDEGGAWSVMSAYNRFNGDFCSESETLLTKILRDEWKFDGAVMSDWWALHDVAKGFNAGLGICMPAKPEDHKKLLALVEFGDVGMEKLDAAVRHNVRFLVRAGAFDAARKGAINTPEHQALARRAACEAMVLLKNDGALLPLDAAKLQRVAVIGPNADWKHSRTSFMDSGGSGAVFPPHEITPLAGLRERLGDRVVFAPGVEFGPAGKASAAGIDAAVKAAREADVAVVFAGTNHTYDKEAIDGDTSPGADKPDLGLPGPQAELIAAVAAANPRTVVVLINGAPVSVEEWLGKIPALVEAWHPGMEGGRAIADVLLGDAEPGGRLPVTFGRRLEDWRSHAMGAEVFPGKGGVERYDDGIWIGYRHFDKAGIEPRFPFGFGLGYAVFAFSDLRVKAGAETGTFAVTLRVKNTGHRAGSEVAQIYVAPPASSKVERPARELRAFAKVALKPGGKKEVSLTLKRVDFAFWDEKAHGWKIEPGVYRVLAGRSSRDLPLGAEVRVAR